jgi:hypothetical protein
MKFGERSITSKSKEIFILLVSLDLCQPPSSGEQQALKWVIHG